MVFQRFNLFPHLTVLDNLCLDRVGAEDAAREAEKLAMQYLQRVKIPEQATSIRASFRAASSSASLSRARCA